MEMVQEARELAVSDGEPELVLWLIAALREKSKSLDESQLDEGRLKSELESMRQDFFWSIEVGGALPHYLASSPSDYYEVARQREIPQYLARRERYVPRFDVERRVFKLGCRIEGVFWVRIQ